MIEQPRWQGFSTTAPETTDTEQIVTTAQRETEAIQ